MTEDHYHHSPCPVCGFATRYKHFGPIPCACNQRVAEHEARKRRVLSAAMSRVWLGILLTLL